MHKLIYLIVILLSMSFTPPIFAGEKTTIRYYDERGKYVGKSETQKNGTSERFYDEKGKYTGKSETSQGETRYYDEKGKYLGKGDKHPNSKKKATHD